MKKFKLIGHNIKHSASPFVHNTIFEYFNASKKYSYELLDLNPLEFEKQFCKIKNFYGVNITAPYKIAAFEKLNLKSKDACFFGCVNTIKKLPDGKLKGFCTDHIGFMKTIKHFNKNFFNNVLIIGFGAMGRMAAKCLMPLCEKMFILLINPLKLAELKKLKLKKPIFVNQNEIINQNFDLVINAAPTVINATHSNNSNNINNSLFNLHQLGTVLNVFDLNYFPTTTKMLKQAAEKGAMCRNGVDMLVWQAIAAQKIWNEFEFSNDFVNNLIKKTSNFLEVSQFE